MSKLVRLDWEALGQLSLGLDVEAVEEELAGLSAEEVAARSEVARLVLDRGEVWANEAPEWFETYTRLREMGFRWRVGVYVAWAASPRQERWPETLEGLAREVLGLASSRVIYTWRKKDPRIDDAIAMLQSAPLFEHRADIYEALIAVATDPDYKGHSDRKLALEMLGDYVPRSRMDLGKAVEGDGVGGLSEAELRKYAGEFFRAGEQGSRGAGEQESGGEREEGTDG